MDERMVNIIDCALYDHKAKPGIRDVHCLESFIAQRLHDAGYRLDPDPNGKSKGELIKRIEELEAERDKARGLLRKSIAYESMLYMDPEACQEIAAFLAETSTVKS